MNRRLLIILSLCVVGVLVVTGLALYGEWFGFEGPRSSGAVAPTLEVSATRQTVYRIDPEQSVVRYAVQETFAGQPMSTAVGTTRQVAGDILLNRDDFAQSQVGAIIINVEQFESDSGLRDRRIRREYLESSTYPEAVFTPRELVDFPTEIVEGTAYTFTIQGDLTVKTTTLPAVWTVTTTLDGDSLRGSASTTLSMAAYGVGPIEIAGLVETADEVQLTFDFVAVAVR